MQVFISWSGPQSLAAASAFRDWLPMLHPTLDVFLSKEDIEKGARWGQEIAQQLNEASFGIICLCRENLQKPWILFESGSISKAVNGEGRLCTFLLDIGPEHVSGPLGQFQHTRLLREDVFKLISDIGKHLKGDRRTSDQLRKAFDSLWPDFEQKLKDAATPPVGSREPPKLDTEETLGRVLGEVLALGRAVQAIDTRLASLLPASELITSGFGGLGNITIVSGRRAAQELDAPSAEPSGSNPTGPSRSDKKPT